MVIVDDLSLIGCIEKSNRRTEEGAIGILRCFKNHGIIIDWSDRLGKLTVKETSKSRVYGSWKSIMKEIMEILKIDSKEDWERIKRKYDL